MIFKAKGKEYPLVEGLREVVKSGWREMLSPAKLRKIELDLFTSLHFVIKAEQDLSIFGETLVGRKILEVGCSYGERSFLMAKYEGTKVHGIDVDEYIVDQSPDLNSWNPKDVEFVHDKLDEVRLELSKRFSMSICNKVTFETCGMENYSAKEPHDLIISWDTLEHIIDLPLAFIRMASALKDGGVCYHEYNPFFSINGGHSLCTLDFLYGHCCLSSEDFDRYIREIRPEEEKIDLNFYHKCLNRATRADVRKYAKDAGFEILEFQGISSFGKETEKRRKSLEEEILKQVQENYPTCIIDDLLCDSVHLILRKK